MRRIYLPALKTGILPLPESQAHHLRDVLRLASGNEVQVFDDAGNTAQATIVEISPQTVRVRIEAIEPAPEQFRLTVASAIPKSARADWMIEKLSELGVYQFVPLISNRSVVLPHGPGKFDRWKRLAAESAKQSRRPGVMRIDPPAPLADLLAARNEADEWLHLSTDPSAPPLSDLARSLHSKSLTLLVGPEGGWTEPEVAAFTQHGVAAAHLTDTILRIETAAIAAAAVVAAQVGQRSVVTRWYAVHALIGFYFKDGSQGAIFAWENVLLISAVDKREARRKAEEISREHEGDSDGSLRIDDRPATQRFVGIRKIVAMASPDEMPVDGTEVTYTELEFANQADLDRYLSGEDVAVRCVNYFRQ